VVNLFRPEVLESRRTSWVGEIQLIRPLSLTVLTGAVVTAAVALGLFLSLAEYTRKVRVSGVLVPDRGVIRLVAPQEALVAERLVVEAQAVRAGEVLFVLSLDRAAASGDTQAAVQRSLSAREISLERAAAQQLLLHNNQMATLSRRLADMQREQSALDDEAALATQRIQLAEQAMSRVESLRDDNFVSSAQVQSKTEELLAVRAQRQALERQRSAHAREAAAVEAQRRELPLDNARRLGEIERDRAELAQQGAESEARRSLVVRAPQDGIVSGVIAQPGQTVTPGVALASLVPAHAQLQAHLYAPSSAVGFLRAKQPVLLRYDAFPYQKYGSQHGQIDQVSLAPLSAAEMAGVAAPLPATAAAAREPMYRIAVTLERQSMPTGLEVRPLVPGMQLEADVPIERRRLVEWLFAPVLGVAGRV
jgi:membrane fusion protein